MSLLLLPLLGCAACTGGPDSTTPGDSPNDSPGDSPIDSEPLGSLDLDFTYDRSVTAGNPLQGFLHSYAWGEPVTDFPASLEFAYIPLNELMDGPDSFTFDEGLEPWLEAAEGRGHQLILRPWIDYPALPSGLPSYLEGQVTMQAYEDFGGGLSPDYEDPDLREAMTAFVAALGERYDGDPRLAFVQVGLLGYWGEWHTWPNSDWFASEAVQHELLNAYTAAFPNTHVQVRYATSATAGMRVGYHDDSFAYSTLGEVDWFFHSQLVDAGAEERWKEVPIGGELRPELQPLIFEPDYETGTYAQDFADCVEATHASYLLNYGAFGSSYESEAERQAAEEAALSLGYEFTLRSLRIEGATASIELENTGVAPFYYPLELVLETDTELRQELTLLPGDSATVDFTVEGRPSLGAPWFLSLDSPHLLDKQRIRFANAEATGEVQLR